MVCLYSKILSWPSFCSNSFLTFFNHSVSLWCSFLSLYIPLETVCASTEFGISYWWFSSSFSRWKNRPWFLTNIRFCWYWLILELNRLIFAPKALIRCFISSLTMLSLFLRILYLFSSLSLCFFLIFLFSSKLFTKSKSRLSSYNFPSNRLFHQGSFFVFGSLLAPTNSVTYAAAACIVLFSSVRFWISIFLSTQMIS